MRFFLPFLTFLIVVPFAISCGGNNAIVPSDSILKSDSARAKGIQVSKSDSVQSVAPSQNVEVKTFEAKDEKGNSTGWGYDLYVDGKRSIHQPIIPAVPGNSSFINESDAKKIGDLAATKMKITGSLPTISVHDLDSLGIKHQ